MTLEQKREVIRRACIAAGCVIAVIALAVAGKFTKTL